MIEGWETREWWATYPKVVRKMKLRRHILDDQILIENCDIPVHDLVWSMMRRVINNMGINNTFLEGQIIDEIRKDNEWGGQQEPKYLIE